MNIQALHLTGLKLAAALVAGFLFHNTAGAADLNQTRETFSAEVTKTFAYKYLKYLPDGYDGKKKFPLLLQWWKPRPMSPLQAWIHTRSFLYPEY